MSLAKTKQLTRSLGRLLDEHTAYVLGLGYEYSQTTATTRISSNIFRLDKFFDLNEFQNSWLLEVF